MRKNCADSRFGALVHGLADANLAASQWLAAVIVVGMAIAVPSRCSAQTTLNFGGNNSTAIFANSGGSVVMSGGMVNGNIDMSAGANKSISGGTVNGQTNANVSANQITLPTGNVGTVGPNNTFTAATTGSVSIFNLSNLIMSSGTMTLNAAPGAGDTFIFLISGALALSGGQMVYHNIDENNVIFIANSIAISGGTAYGTFYSGGGISMSGGNVTGALVAGNGGRVAISGGKLNASPFAAGPTVAGAPETPTIMTAGLAAFLIMGSSGVRYMRRKRASRNPLIAH